MITYVVGASEARGSLYFTFKYDGNFFVALLR